MDGSGYLSSPLFSILLCAWKGWFHSNRINKLLCLPTSAWAHQWEVPAEYQSKWTQQARGIYSLSFFSCQAGCIPLLMVTAPVRWPPLSGFQWLLCFFCFFKPRDGNSFLLVAQRTYTLLWCPHILLIQLWRVPLLNTPQMSPVLMCLLFHDGNLTSKEFYLIWLI